MKIEGSEKAGSHQESNQGHLYSKVSKPFSMGSGENFPVDPQQSSDNTYWEAAGYVTEAFSATCAVHIEDCEDWWLSSCCGSVAEHWWLKLEVSWVLLLATACFFTFLYFRLITSKFIYFQHEARCSEHQDQFSSFQQGECRHHYCIHVVSKGQAISSTCRVTEKLSSWGLQNRLRKHKRVLSLK